MFGKESPVFLTAHKEAVEGPLNERWSSLLAEVFIEIDEQKKLLQESTQKLFHTLQILELSLKCKDKKLKLIFLTRQGVPIYWLLRGAYDSQGLEMPDCEVLGIKRGNSDSETTYKTEDEHALKEILGIGQESMHGVFIDELINLGRTIHACFNLVEQLAGSRENYSQAALLDREQITAPWDIMQQNLNGYFKSANRFFSIHLYNSPESDGWSSVAEPARLNENSSSQIAAYYVASKLYEIGFESK